MDVDVGKNPEPHQLSPATEPATIPTLDGWIENLMSCKQLSETDVRRLTDRVRFLSLHGNAHKGFLGAEGIEG